MSYRSKAYLQLLLVSVVWGFAGPIIKFALGQLDPLVFLLYRFALAGSVALITLPFLRLKLSLPIIIYSFLTSTVSLGLLFWGFAKTSSIEGTLISSIAPILVAVAGVAFLHEHVTKREIVGIIIALIGTLIIIPSASITGNLLVLASVLVGVVTSVMAKVLLRHHEVSPLGITQLSFATGLLTTIPLTFYFYSPQVVISAVRSVPLSVHAAVWYMAFASGTFAYWLWHRAQKTIEIGETALFVYTYPFFAAPLSFLWLKETVTPLFWLGAAITAGGILVAELKPSRPNSHP